VSHRFELHSDGPETTEAIAAEVARAVPAGTTLGLLGRLGAGKTCFVRGLAAGLGADPDDIASPTFVYLVDYVCAHGRRLHHADLYRLADLAPDRAGEVFESIGLTAAIQDEGITAVEWWEHHRGPAPTRLVTVEFVVEKADDRAIFFELAGPDMDTAAECLSARAATSG